jgi:hypothetical protein
VDPDRQAGAGKAGARTENPDAVHAALRTADQIAAAPQAAPHPRPPSAPGTPATCRHADPGTAPARPVLPVSFGYVGSIAWATITGIVFSSDVDVRSGYGSRACRKNQQ